MSTFAPTTFASSLRGWRERQRVSQLELALRAGTTQRHISFIERGRSLPGRGMIVRLTEALEVPLRERNAMLLGAGFAPAYRETALDDPSLDPVRGALEHVLAGHAPYPAVITDREGFLVSGNAPFRALLGPLAEPPGNLPRVLLSPDGLASRIRNLDEWGWHVIDGIRRKALRHPGSQLAALADELEQRHVRLQVSAFRAMQGLFRGGRDARRGPHGPPSTAPLPREPVGRGICVGTAGDREISRFSRMEPCVRAWDL